MDALQWRSGQQWIHCFGHAGTAIRPAASVATEGGHGLRQTVSLGGILFLVNVFDDFVVEGQFEPIAPIVGEIGMEIIGNADLVSATVCLDQ